MTAYRLPLPPSANRLVMPVVFRGRSRAKPIVRLVATPEARAFREAARAKLPIEPIAGPVELYLTVYLSSIASDAQNREKALCDACNGRLYYDDKQIAELHLVKVIVLDESQVCVVVEVKPADPLEHRELAARLAKSKVQQLANADAQAGLEFHGLEDGVEGGEVLSADSVKWRGEE